MNADEALHLLRRLGLTLTATDGRLIVTPAELLDSDTRWLIRKHRDGILTELLDDSPAWAWIARFSDGSAKEIYRHPPAVRAEIKAAYESAISIERLPECDWPLDPNKTEESTK